MNAALLVFLCVQISDLVIQTANSGLNLQNADGSFPSGYNGPYGDNDTPVRNTSHWLITLLKAYEYSGDNKYKLSSEKALNYLCSSKARPHDVAFFHREGNRYRGQNQTNGLIGQAWTIEAFAMASEHFQKENIANIAADTFLAHPFNYEVGIWKQIDVDGTIQGYCTTFNQQLWFAVAGLLLLEYADVDKNGKLKKIENRTNIFFQNIHNLIHTSPKGLIIHPLFLPSPKIYNFIYNTDVQIEVCDKWIRTAIMKFKDVIRYRSTSRLIRKSRPYHAFNLYAFAILYTIKPNLPFWETNKFQKIIDYSKNPVYFNHLEKSEFGFGYNPPGFELPFSWHIFDGEISEMSRSLIQKQLRHSYDFSESLMLKNTSDKATHAARFYELTRIPDISIEMYALG